MSTNGAIRFVVPGSPQPTARGAATQGAAPAALPAGLPRGTVKQAVSVGTGRGGGGAQKIDAVPGEDVVVLEIAGGPNLVLHPETARDLMLAQGATKASRGTGEPVTAASDVNVPIQLRWGGAAGAGRGATRGLLGDVLLKAVRVVTGVAKDSDADYVADKVVERFDGQVVNGVYALKPEALPRLKGTPMLQQVPASPTGKPILVLLHGTFSNASGTFGKLWSEHPAHVRTLFDRYAGNVVALDHPTLGASPIDNALTLVRALPDGAHLHLLSHSRGGLVAETLARVCATGAVSGDGLTPFAGEPYAAQRAALEELAALVTQRRIAVDRVVRVACPARGTLLASNRLDAYLSVFKWALELAHIPVLDELVDFLAAVAQRRQDPTKIPGLAAQMPDSPLVQWLHAAEEPIPGELRVIAGDMQGDSVVSWIKTLLADAYYWTDNDLVVQTRSMYGGAPRANGASFLLDQGGQVSHFSYFSNADTADAVVNALISDQQPPGFRSIGPLSWSGESATGVRGAAPVATPDKPAVFILPGILGSNLKVDGKRVWLSWRLVTGLDKLAYRAQAGNVEPDGPIGMIYDKLSAFLAKTYEVTEFAFDWRVPMEQEAGRLGLAVKAALDVRRNSRQPVRLLAHSMGGLLARTMQLECPDVWDEMMGRDGRLVMLGTPNDGSWAPMQVLSGDDSFGNLMVTFGAPFQDHAARTLMAQLPGFIQLQAALQDTELGLRDEELWQTLADGDLAAVEGLRWWHKLPLQIAVYQWGVPKQAVLDQAVGLWKRLANQRDGDLARYKDRMALVVGNAPVTPDGFRRDTAGHPYFGDDGLEYLNTLQGDGRVPLVSAMIPGVPAWKLDCDHSSLPKQQGAFDAFHDLLEKGTTTRLEPQPVLATRGAAATAGAFAPAAVRRGRLRSANRPPDDAADVLGVGADPIMPRATAMPALRISVVNGDLGFVHRPLLLGHYRSLRLTGTERAVNRFVGHVMDDSLKLGLYPVAPGTHKIFMNPYVRPDDPSQLPRPEAAVIVGLGEEGKLRGTDLLMSVRQATIAWAQREAEKADPATQFELAATLIGSGGSGITIGQAAQQVAQGVREANERLFEANERVARLPTKTDHSGASAKRRLPTVGHLYLIELYGDRANEAWRALRVQEAVAPQEYVVTDEVRVDIGALPRPIDSGYRGAEYDFVSVSTAQDENGDAIVQYTLDTNRARSEVRAHSTQGALVRQIVARASNDVTVDRQLGCSLFKLLVPVEIQPFLAGSSEIQMGLDRGTAAIPWELLTPDGTAADGVPWAISSKLLRKLRTDDYRLQVEDATPEGSILVIGEPHCDPAIYPRLPAARAEAIAVADQLDAALGDRSAVQVVRMISPEDPERFGADADAIISTLLNCERPWRIVHIAGHGEPPERTGPEPRTPHDPPQRIGEPRGVVLSDGIFLGWREIKAMSVVPELVFINCCHLGARDSSEAVRADEQRLGQPYNRTEFAATVAEELIKIGVRCVIAAGWAVNDEAARVFATRFYEATLRSTRFIDAVAEARRAAYEKGGNTWAAYQCYGDPDWAFHRQAADAQQFVRSQPDEFAAIACADDLSIALRTQASDAQYRAPERKDKDAIRAKVELLESRHAERWGTVGSVAEAFGAAYIAVDELDKAIDWYQRALTANDGSAALKSAEQLANAHARRAEKHFDGTNLSAVREEIGAALSMLQALVKIEPTVERWSLCGSAWKRRAQIERRAGNSDDATRAIGEMRDAYAAAEKLARDGKDTKTLYYPALNRMAGDVILEAATSDWHPFDAAEVEEIRQSLASLTRDEPDFWNVAGRTDLLVYEAIGKRTLAAALPDIERGYRDLYGRVSASWRWGSVRDQLEFFLPYYASRAEGVEKEAVSDLLALVGELAGQQKDRS